MRKLYKYLAKSNSISFTLVGKTGNEVRYTFEGNAITGVNPTLSTDNEYYQKLLEESALFRRGVIRIARVDYGTGEKKSSKLFPDEVRVSALSPQEQVARKLKIIEARKKKEEEKRYLADKAEREALEQQEKEKKEDLTLRNTDIGAELIGDASLASPSYEQQAETSVKAETDANEPLFGISEEKAQQAEETLKTDARPRGKQTVKDTIDPDGYKLLPKIKDTQEMIDYLNKNYNAGVTTHTQAKKFGLKVGVKFPNVED